MDAFLGAVEPDDKRRDCQTLAALMARVTGEPATMWGPSIVGFGVHHYRCESGRELDADRAGKTPTQPNLESLALMGPRHEA